MMTRSPCCDEKGVKKGPWTPEEDKKLKEYIEEQGLRSWRVLPALAGLNRCGKSCRLRWTNYLRPDIKRGNFAEEEEENIIRLHAELGNKWSIIATHLPGRTDNEIKNHWNTHLRKKLLQRGIDPVTHKPRPDLTLMASLPNLLALTSSLQTPNIDVAALRNATHLARLQLVQSILNLLVTPDPQLDPTSVQSPINSSLLGGPAVHPSNQLQGMDVPPPMHVSPDLGVDAANASNFVDFTCPRDPGCTTYVPANANSGGLMVAQQVNAANIMDASTPSTSSANSNMYECDQYDAWSGLEEFVKGDFYVHDGGFGHENSF